MTNITTSLSGSILTITIDTAKSYGPSSSGKTTIVASSAGAVKVDTPTGPLSVNITAYRK